MEGKVRDEFGSFDVATCSRAQARGSASYHLAERRKEKLPRGHIQRQREFA